MAPGPQDDGTDVKCEGDYFSCAPHKDFSEATSVCLPLAAKCDGFKQCSDEVSFYHLISYCYPNKMNKQSCYKQQDTDRRARNCKAVKFGKFSFKNTAYSEF